jgi:hypothetical protein
MTIREVQVDCFKCHQPFVASVPVLTRVCPGCQLTRSTRPERCKFAVTETCEGKRMYIVKRFVEVGGFAYWQHWHEAADIEGARTVIPNGARRFDKGLSDSPDVVETWIG